MEFSATQIAQLLNGKVEGNPEIKVNSISKIEEGKTGSLSFLANLAYTNFIYSTDASIVLLNHSLRLERPVKSSCTLIRVENAYESFAK
jgi:UDP-3-O-[3-hydroxymyristoyl] glucosamine N-acyltransferase